jgi:uncharacterized protein
MAREEPVLDEVVQAFSPLAREALGWYVYLLEDGERQPFYVGKGRGDRAFAHASDAHDVADDHPELQSAKHARILKIENEGGRVRVIVLRHGISSSVQAYEVESAAIDLINRLRPGTLLNVVLGHHHAQRGLMPAAEVEVLYAARPAPPLQVPVLLVSLNQLWRPDIAEDELFEITRGWWKANGPRSDAAQYVLGVHNGVVRSVYKPVTWRKRAPRDRDFQHDAPGKERWGFDGSPAPEMASFLRTSVSRFITTKQWSHLYAGPEPPAAAGPS